MKRFIFFFKYLQKAENPAFNDGSAVNPRNGRKFPKFGGNSGIDCTGGTWKFNPYWSDEHFCDTISILVFLLEKIEIEKIIMRSWKKLKDSC